MAAHFGLYEAIILQFLFWVKEGESAGRVLEDGHRYCYNTYSDWHELYPFISERTLRRTFTEMEAKGLICSIQPSNYDRTKFYRISDAIIVQDSKGYFDELPSSHDLPEIEEKSAPCGQIGLNDAAKLAACTNVHRSHESLPELKIQGGKSLEVDLFSQSIPKSGGQPPIESPAPKKRGRPPKPTDPRHHEAIQMWCEMYEKRFQAKYGVTGADVKNLKTFLQTFPHITVAEMRNVIDCIWSKEVALEKWASYAHRIHTMKDLVCRWNQIVALIQTP